MTAEDDLGDILEEIDRNLNGDKEKQGMMIYWLVDQELIASAAHTAPYPIPMNAKMRDLRIGP